MTEFIRHDGNGCPLAVGTRVCVVYRSGRESVETIDDGDHEPMMRMLEVTGDELVVETSCWTWAINERPDILSGFDIVAYRIDDAAKDSRSEMFREWLKPVREMEDA